MRARVQQVRLRYDNSRFAIREKKTELDKTESRAVSYTALPLTRAREREANVRTCRVRTFLPRFLPLGTITKPGWNYIVSYKARTRSARTRPRDTHARAYEFLRRREHEG